MRYFKAWTGFGPLYGMEEDSPKEDTHPKRWIWEDGCYQIFPDLIYETLHGLEYINPIDFFRFMKEHCEMMIKELVDREVRQDDS